MIALRDIGAGSRSRRVGGAAPFGFFSPLSGASVLPVTWI